MIDFYDDILGIDEKELDGFSFNFTSDFRIIDSKNGFLVELHKLYKRSYKSFENQINIILKNNPLDIKDISNIELDDFKINKLYKGFFIVHFYENNNYDIFLKEYNLLNTKK